jgi:hypothetical protein
MLLGACASCCICICLVLVLVIIIMVISSHGWYQNSPRARVTAIALRQFLWFS